MALSEVSRSLQPHTILVPHDYTHAPQFIQESLMGNITSELLR